MQEIYDQLDGDDSEFLGNQLAGEYGENNTFGSDSDSDSSEKIQRDETSDVELGNCEEVQHKQKFNYLDKCYMKIIMLILKVSQISRTIIVMLITL